MMRAERHLTSIIAIPNHEQGLILRPLLLPSLIFCAVLFHASLACAQAPSNASSTPQSSQSPNSSSNPSASADSPLVTFTLDFPESSPEHYSIRVPFAGSAHYESTGKLSSDSDVTDSFDFDFSISPDLRSKIFALAAKAGYFQKNLEAHRKNLAFTGKKTLHYSDALRTGESTYNYSSNAAAEDLTTLFQNLSATLEFGHRLNYYRRYQKLALDDELKRMQEMAHSNTLIEVAAIQPILEQIVADPAVINVTRARAQRLMTGASGH